GCNSCPPADRWLSGLKGRSDVVALAFHVDYWDRLGWVDRFADAAYTRRQVEQQRLSGGGFVYTPQVLVDGRDWRRWPTLPAASARDAGRHRCARRAATGRRPQLRRGMTAPGRGVPRPPSARVRPCLGRPGAAAANQLNTPCPATAPLARHAVSR